MDSLDTVLKRGCMHAGNFTPADGLPYRTIHDAGVQDYRRSFFVHDGRNLHDFLPFYFGPRSPMLYRLFKNSVEGYNEGQEPIVYLVLRAQDFEAPGFDFLFTDSQANKNFARYYNDLADLDKLDWITIYRKYWGDTLDDNRRMGRKQAEFLVHKKCPFEAVRAITVFDESYEERVMEVLARHGRTLPVKITREWYY
jgi:hypothetical protein